jgi:hypothetical protein
MRGHPTSAKSAACAVRACLKKGTTSGNFVNDLTQASSSRHTNLLQSYIVGKQAMQDQIQQQPQSSTAIDIGAC